MFSLASVGTITACLFLFGIFYFILSNFQYTIKNAEASVAVTVFFDEGIGEERIERIGQEIKLRGEVAQVNYISAEEAWASFKNDVLKGQQELIETFSADNPLANSACYEVYLNDVSMQTSLVHTLETMEGVRQVNSFDTTAKALESFNRLVSIISLSIVVILIAVAIFLISNTVSLGISVRKEEITIMRLIGATDFFVQGPFIVEGIAIGLIGACIPLVLLSFLYVRIIAYVSTKFNLLAGVLTFLDIQEVFSVLVPVSLCMGIGIGFIGSYLTVRKHLRV